MSAKGKEYKLAVRIAGVVDKSYEAALVSANAQLKTFKASLGKTEASFARLDKGYDKIASVGKKAFSTIAKAATVATVATAAVASKTIQIGSSFEAEMSTVQAISNATVGELAELSQKARDVAKNTVFSAEEVGQAMEYMGMAGWKTEQMLDGIDGVIALAAASGEDLAMVSDIVTDSLTAMGQGADQAGHFADIMAQASMNANTNVELMGETFKYVAPVAGAMGYNMEDLAIATGLMADSGIKGSMAGTSLRNMITRMVKPTKESQDAMDALGLSLTDDAGNMLSLLDIMKQLRASFADNKDVEKMQSALTELAGLTDEQITEVQESLGDLSEAEEAFYAAELGGQRGMSGLLAIANSTDEEFEKLTQSIYNANGAAEKMSDTRLDNLQGDVTKLKDALSDAAIEGYYQFNDQLRMGVQGAMDIVNNFAKKIPDISKKIQAALPTLKRKFNQYVVPVLDTVKDVGGWVIDHGDTIISIVGGVAAGMAAFKIGEGAFRGFKGIMELFTGLTPYTGAILGLSSVIGIVTTSIINYKQALKERIDNNLTEHFGTLSLTIDELKEVAEYLTSTDAFEGIKKAMSAFDDLEPFESAMSDAMDTLNKMNWKVSVGMELDLEDQESYKAAVDQYIKNVQEYAEQSRFAANLNLTSLLTGTDSNKIISDVDMFYATQQGELERLGKELNEAITEAFNDGLLEIDEVDKVAQIQRQMAEIQEQLAASELQANLKLLDTKYGGGNLTAESFQNLQAEISEAVEENAKTYEESYKKALSSIYATYEAGGKSTEWLAEAEAEAAAGYRTNMAEMSAQALQFQLDTIFNQYDIEGLNKQINDVMAGAMDKYLNPERLASDMEYYGSYGAAFAQEYEAMQTEFLKNVQDILGGDEDAIQQLATLAQDSYKQLETTAQMFKDAGEAVPENVQAALDQWGELSSLLDLSGIDFTDDNGAAQSEAIYQYFNNVLNGGAYDEILAMEDEWGDAIGAHLPESLQKGVQANSGNYRNAATTAKQQVQSAFDSVFATPISIMLKVKTELDRINSSIPTSVRQEIAKNSGSVDSNATGGFIQHKELSWLAEDGPEAVIPLDGSANAMELWKKTGQMLGMPDLSSRYDLSGAASSSNTNISYSPTLQFYGDAPSKQDMTEALKISQDEFSEMMDQYIRNNNRVAFR